MSKEIYDKFSQEETMRTIVEELRKIKERILGGKSMEISNRTIEDARARIKNSKSDQLLNKNINYYYASTLLEEKKFDRYTQCIALHLGRAKKIQETCGIPMAVSLAQMLNETDAGTSPLAKRYNNFHGLTCKIKHDHKKCFGKNDGLPGGKVIFNYFMNFADKDASRTEYGNRISKNDLYKPCFESGSLRGWCENLQGKYAHAPTYAKSLFTLIMVFGLDKIGSAGLPLIKWAYTKQTVRPIVEKKKETVNQSKENITPKGGTLFDIVKKRYSAELAEHNNDYTLELTVTHICLYLRKNYPNNIRVDGETVTLIVPKDLTLEKVRASVF